MPAGPGHDELTPSLPAGAGESLVPVGAEERHFGRYLLRYEIAAGGMATVYLARSRGPAGFDRPLALKRIHPHLAKKREFVEMFLDEARLSARITHPNVCSVFDFGEVDGTYYMAMEYLVGQPLVAVLRALDERPEIANQPRWYALAARIVADAAEGLHAAHELRDERGELLGVVHRDLSPHNVFVTYDGAVKVVDFGIAWSEGRLHHTQTGSLKGKLAYMSPEQVRGMKIDCRLDVWALGVCLWELLAVRRLFGKRSEVELIQAVVKDPILPASVVHAGVPLVLDDIALRALERDLDQRFPTARAMARELNAYVSGSGIPTGLADLAELMEELFPRERAEKLGVVATVLGTGSSSLRDHTMERLTTRADASSGGTPSASRPGARADRTADLAADRTAEHPADGTIERPDRVAERTMTAATVVTPPEAGPRHDPTEPVAHPHDAAPMPSDLPPIPEPSRGAPVLAILAVIALAAVIGAGIYLQHVARMQGTESDGAPATPSTSAGEHDEQETHRAPTIATPIDVPERARIPVAPRPRRAAPAGESPAEAPSETEATPAAAEPASTAPPSTDAPTLPDGELPP